MSAAENASSSSSSSFGKRSTALDVVAGRSLQGKRALVTGGASGIGTETVRALSSAGADVVVAVRNVDAGRAALRDVIDAAKSKGSAVDVRALDLADFASVRAFASGVEGTFDTVINNAGVMASPLSFTKQGFELQMGTNHLGHFLLITSLLPKLANGARVVVVASAAHTRGSARGMFATLDDDKKYEKRKYSAFNAYGDSKIANILFARALQKRLAAAAKGQTAYSLHPGVIPTPLVRHMGVLGDIYRVVGKPFMKTVQQGAATSVYCATWPGLEAKAGAYFADCHETVCTEDAKSDDNAEKLWVMSEKLVAA